MKNTILVVEDEQDLLSSIKFFLESEGYNVIAAENGLIALNLIHNQGVPNMILLDMKMPVMNGWQFADAFSKKYKDQSPIVVMTAAPSAERRAQEINAIKWLSKPFELDDLLRTVKEVIQV